MNPQARRRTHRLFRQALRAHGESASRSLAWLQECMHPYFFITMADDPAAVVNLASGLASLAEDRRITLVDREKKLVWACLNRPGSVYEALLALPSRPLSYAEITHSYRPIPELCCEVEIQRFEFDRKPHALIAQAGPAPAPASTRRAVARALRALYPTFDFGELDKCLGLLWRNDEAYVRISPPERVARVLWLYQQGRRHDGLFLDVENTQDVLHHRESRLLFAVGNPDERGFLAQVLEVFHRLGLAVRRSYCLLVSTGVHPYFLGTFYVTTRDGGLLEKHSELFRTLQAELYNTQILSTAGHTYTGFVADRVMTGEEASLTNALVAFCHTSLAHAQPDRFDLGEVRRAFHASPDVCLALARLFRARFDPDVADRDAACAEALAAAEALVSGYNTGHRHLDEVRRTIFRTALLLATRTLKTNFFVPEKHALAFRLDPAYLKDLGEELTADLPAGDPFRVTFFYGRHGAGYHVGFSDIARGGWRTVLCRSADDFLTATNTLFREVYVLAHTQHLKNKDIYEGGSKMVVALDVSDLAAPAEAELRTQRLYKLQYGFLNAFLDLFVTHNGRARHPRVVDYYGEDEPIELGPDENMHDAMIELIARQAAGRGYLLGKGIMSSKRVGINHKEYGVTSLGVVTMAETVLRELGIEPRTDPFDVTLTGGTNGDVAGNAMRLLLTRCPRARLKVIVAGSGALFDPEGADREELSRLILQADLDAFDPGRLHPGGFLLLRRGRRQEGLKELYRKLRRTPSGVEEQWVTADDFHREFDGLITSVPADLFVPGGGRPETVDANNVGRFFREDGTALVGAVVEGANSFVTPAARAELQRRGVVVLRDASANKCGVISSSYEILANLLLSDAEFLARKAAYVADVLAILEMRAEEEARLIFRRHREAGGTRLYTEISDALSAEINAHYERLFAFFLAHPGLAADPLMRRVLLAHLPALVGRDPALRRRVGRLPLKIRCAILAVELATAIVYRGGWEPDLATSVREYAKRQFGG
ncbi:MAG: NAD-glutamate dehydrogenase domain-containing protein [Thermodesulfobacteriota bacterium]